MRRLKSVQCRKASHCTVTRHYPYTVIKIHIPQGYVGCQYLRSVALPKFKNQDEVLFARGMQYRVLNVRIENDRYFLEIEVLSNV